MDALNQLLTALGGVMQPLSLLIMAGGVFVGIIFGAIPGLSAAMAVALFLPITFTMTAGMGLNLLVAVYIGGISGGLISAILLKMPGTASSIATTFDGHPMALKGDAKKALGYGVFFSFLGSVFSFIILTFLAPPFADIALKFTPVENFGITLFALVMVAILASGSMIKGILSGMLGLIFSLVGMAPIDGIARFTFGNRDLMAGFDALPTLIGIFAISEILITCEKMSKTKEAKSIQINKAKGFGFTWKEFVYQLPNFFRSALIGTGIGILPGIGGSTSGMLAYVTAKNLSKTPEEFGKGIADGIVATETANNATIGGAMVPLMVLGIPGDGVTAMMLGGFLVHGLSPGPLLFVKSPDIVYGIFAACMVASVLMLIIEFFGMKIFVQLIRVPKHILLPIILVLCSVGAFATNNKIFDVQSILLFGVIGYLFYKFKLATAPFVLTFLIGEMLETYLRRGLMLQKTFGAFFTRPIFAVLFALSVFILLWTIYKEFIVGMKNKKAGTTQSQ